MTWLTKLSTVDSISDIIMSVVNKQMDLAAATVNLNAIGNPAEACNTIMYLQQSNPESSHLLNVLATKIGCNNIQNPISQSENLYNEVPQNENIDLSNQDDGSLQQ